MYHPTTELPLILVGKYAELMDSDDAGLALTVEMIVIDVIMFTHECNAPTARRILATLMED